MTTVAGLLLAAGAGRRLGTPKALVTLRGRLLVEHGVALLRDGGCDPVVVVLGAARDEVRQRANLHDATVVINAQWENGLSSSLRVGLEALERTAAAAAVIGLVDQPLVRPAAVQRLIAAWRAGATAAVATYCGRPRNPVLIGRSGWAKAAVLAAGDTGARAFLRENPSVVTPVPCEDVAEPLDIDTASDLASASALMEGGW